jgi:cyclopropane-fatty-acyl-phospholipid synthase
MSALVSSTLDTFRGYAGSTAWAPLVRISRAAVLSLLHRIEFGCLLITDETGSQTRCGRDAGLGSHVCATPPRAELNIKREAFWVRLALFADMVCQVASTHRRLYG